MNTILLTRERRARLAKIDPASPVGGIHDPRFRYTHSQDMDSAYLHKRFKAIRREQARRAEA